jgi:hypothetical protein
MLKDGAGRDGGRKGRRKRVAAAITISSLPTAHFHASRLHFRSVFCDASAPTSSRSHLFSPNPRARAALHPTPHLLFPHIHAAATTTTTTTSHPPPLCDSPLLPPTRRGSAQPATLRADTTWFFPPIRPLFLVGARARCACGRVLCDVFL